MHKYIAVGVLSVAFHAGVEADANVILVGGGYKLEGSQGQIELNLKWVQDILEKRIKTTDVYYTDGDGENPDVILQAPIEDKFENLQPLARVFGQQDLNLISYRDHDVKNVSSETTADVLIPALADKFAQVAPDDSTLLVYNGHGSPSSSGAEKVALKLWEDTRLTAEQLHSLLANYDPNADFRYIFTQCYSGGFHRLIYADPVDGFELAEGQRCGFTAESSWRQSEGCSASIDMGDYRDYTTFFFAAINGLDRLGRPLLADPDRNSDGIASMREAHLYTLEFAHSTDLSRSSSEDYLEQWRPWFLKWVPQGGIPLENEYGDLARSVGARIGLSGNDLVNSARKRGKDYRDAYSSLNAKKYASHEKAESLRGNLQQKLTAKWPQLKSPYTLAYKSLLFDELSVIQNWIVSQETYDELQALQNSDLDFEKQLLDLERHIAQTDKVLRLRRLAFLKEWLYEYGEEQDIKSYEDLVSCEASPL